MTTIIIINHVVKKNLWQRYINLQAVYLILQIIDNVYIVHRYQNFILEF
ncbi:hypothetical protein IJ22_05170 [Paenibacillus naphthalenovorans]|uniref:Uncharacterized protein n=1 Tax=Paenibacillus naphthalenovorans TaxID=162209 RepID=A0A0U2U3J7_9BACL|nr:hypothetical protein IJ22_05170 [Paenibacillus naphthalenovorans]SDI58119.1 hypothetical protein SAMN05421868_1089 [Paenibacillus naphthalenovorans]